ncbi:hypothetical protein A6E01_19570 (plasmid) [Vibrio breoganii]|uniref:Nucleoside diphosphate kinase-like domain-containing protein n=1 Tax=Vibrio breoganii TaxID=553239 RepID=A0AAN0XZC4_9VIBR|nr:nucleoside-diphosphate kinase [Vibrio breoganii]ANO35414.1 hypothetical protein A6E01_19570 [Vibrio breoganii]PML12659.1 hypothetical protein BCT84_01910 [Vibrio breoganii]
MAKIQRTLGMVKPCNFKNSKSIMTNIKDAGFTLSGATCFRWSKQAAAEFYIEHKDKPFYGELIDYLTEGDVLVFVLEGEDVVSRFRKFVGNTDPKKAAKGTLRALYGESKARNGIHSSANVGDAEREIALSGVMAVDAGS